MSRFLQLSDPFSRQGDGGGAGEPPVQRSLPLHPRQTYLLCLRLGPVVGSWRGTHLRSSFISFRATSFLCVWRSMGRQLTPDGSSHLFRCHSFGLAYMAPNSCHPRFHHRHQHHLSMICRLLGLVLSVFLRISTCRAKVCVSFWLTRNLGTDHSGPKAQARKNECMTLTLLTECHCAIIIMCYRFTCRSCPMSSSRSFLTNVCTRSSQTAVVQVIAMAISQTVALRLGRKLLNSVAG